MNYPGFCTVKMFSELKPKSVAAPVVQPEAPKVSDDQLAVESLLVESPDMNAATFLNLLKSKGFRVVKDELALPEGKQAQEAEGGSSHTAVLRAETKESDAVQPKGQFSFRAKFTEALAKDDGTGVTRFRVALIQEGLGNLKDGFYYTREAIQSAIPLFEGKKIYADHPSATEEATRPERSVKDVLGHFEDVRLEEGAEGQSMLTADVVVLPEEPYRWARALMRHSVNYAKKYPDKDFIGLSINAGGQASTVSLEEFNKSVVVPESTKVKMAKAIEEGLTKVKVVSRLDSAVSCDLVTEAGAGGKVLAMLEQEKQMDKQEEKKESEMEATQQEALPEHADEEQDIALIKKLLKDHLGDEDAESEEVGSHFNQACEAYQSMGKAKEEAMKCAAEYMKASKHMAAKQAEAKAAEPKEKECKQADEPEQKESAVAVSGESPEAKHKESVEAVEAMAQLKGENARLKEALKKIEIKEYIETKCKESKESRAITDEFKKLVEGAKTKGEIDKLWEAFTKGAGVKRAGVAQDFTSFVMTEKAIEPARKASSFMDCLK